MLELLGVAFLLTILTIFKAHGQEQLKSPISAYLISLWLLAVMIATTNLIMLTKLK